MRFAKTSLFRIKPVCIKLVCRSKTRESPSPETIQSSLDNPSPGMKDFRRC